MYLEINNILLNNTQANEAISTEIRKYFELKNN